jgi:hypothetical protein
MRLLSASSVLSGRGKFFRRIMYCMTTQQLAIPMAVCRWNKETERRKGQQTFQCRAHTSQTLDMGINYQLLSCLTITDTLREQRNSVAALFRIYI